MKRLMASLLALLLSIAATGAGASWKVQEIPSPAGPSSGEPFLAVQGRTVYLSWLEKQEAGGHHLRMAAWDGAGWSKPATIVSSDSLFVNWADFPSIIALRDGSLAAHWLARAGEGTYAYHAWVATSGDGGASWSSARRLHSDVSETEHGFVTLLQGDRGLAAAWLDGRNYADSEAGGHGSEEMMLLFGSGTDVTSNGETVLDSRVCDCCQTAGAAIPGGFFLAYRDRSQDEVRDISYVRRVNGRWSEPRTLHADGWKIAACPVNGPAVAANGNNVAVAWFTSPRPLDKDGTKGEANRRVQVIFSSDGGEHFGAPVRVDGNHPLGRVDVRWVDDESVLVVWLEKAGGKAAIRARRVHADGRLDETWTVAPTQSARGSGFPRLAVTEHGVLAAWTDAGQPSKVRLALLSPPGRRP
jgi:hypothetical protein